MRFFEKRDRMSSHDDRSATRPAGGHAVCKRIVLDGQVMDPASQLDAVRILLHFPHHAKNRGLMLH